MKLIEKKVVKVAPELIWGNKYVATGDSQSSDVKKGEVVILATSKPDSDGDVRVFGEVEWDYINAKNLQPVAEEEEGNQIYTVSGESRYGVNLEGKKVFKSGTTSRDGIYVAVKLQGSNSSKDYLVKPKQLVPDPEAIPSTYTVELSEAEVETIVSEMSKQPVTSDVSYHLFKELQELLEGGK